MGDEFEEALKKSWNLHALQYLEPEQALEMFIELLDGDVSEMSDLSDSNDEKSDSKYLLLNPKLKLTQLELTHDSPPPNDFLGSHDLEEHGPSTSSDRATEDHPTNRVHIPSQIFFSN